MNKYKNVAKGKYIIIKKLEGSKDFMEFGEDIEVDKIKYLMGEIVSVGKNVDKDELQMGMLVKCAEFVAAAFGDGEFGVHEDDIMCQIAEVE